MTDEQRDGETMAPARADGNRPGAFWWKAAIGLLLSLALIVMAVWLRLESRTPQRPAGAFAPYSALNEDATQPGTVTLRLPVDL